MKYKGDRKRLKAKIRHKLRWYYTAYLQEKKRRLLLYRSYRHWVRAKGADTERQGPPCYMTKLVNPSAGIGDQLASWISGLYYARRYGLSYAFSPVYPWKWDEFLGLAGHEPAAEELLWHQGYRKVWLPYFEEDNPQEDAMIRSIIASYQGKKIVFFLELHQVYGAQYGVRGQLKERFEAAGKGRREALLYQDGEVNIAVHVRRGDIAQGQAGGSRNLKMRWLDNQYYGRILGTVTELLGERKYHIYLFTQGEQEEFREFMKFGPFTFCGDVSAMDSFLHFVRADILITSKSSFSYKPALIADGIRICPRDFWHGYPQEEEWVLAEEDGAIDRQAFVSALRKQGI